MTDASNAEYTGPLSKGTGDSAGAAHSGVDSSGAGSGPDAANAAQAGVHGDGGPVEITADNLTTASRMSFESAMHANMPDVLMGLHSRWGADFDERLAGVHAIATNKLDTLGPEKFGQLIDDLSEKGWLADPRFWDGLSRMPAAKRMPVNVAPTPKGQQVPGTAEDMKGTLDGLRRRQRDLARSGPIGSVRAQALQPEIDALDRQVNGNGPIIGKQGRSA